MKYLITIIIVITIIILTFLVYGKNDSSKGIVLKYKTDKNYCIFDSDCIWEMCGCNYTLVNKYYENLDCQPCTDNPNDEGLIDYNIVPAKTVCRNFQCRQEPEY